MNWKKLLALLSKLILKLTVAFRKGNHIEKLTLKITNKFKGESMCLAHEILHFFNDGYLLDSTLRPHSFMSFIEKYPDLGRYISTNEKYLKKLEQEGLLNSQGRTGDHPSYGGHYY